MPEPLRSRVGPLGDGDWQRLVPGLIQHVPLDADRGTLRLVRMRPGAVVPDHGHQGEELNLVLSGGFLDRGEHFDRGDLAVADADVEHDLRVDPGEHCVILQLLDGPIVPRTLLGRVVGALTGES
jgi:putative transcriptional regulator